MEVCDDFGSLIPQVSLIVNNFCNGYLLSVKACYTVKSSFCERTVGNQRKGSPPLRDFCIIVEEANT